MNNLNADEIKHIASDAAREAVKEMLLVLGIDISDPKALLETQKDFAHNRSWREATETIRTKGLVVATGIVISGILGAAWMAIRGSN